MTQTTYTDNVEIQGSRDTTQLNIKAHSAQNQPLQTFQANDGSVLSQVSNDGRLQVGDDLGMATPDALVEAHRAETSTSKPKRGFHALGQITGTLNTIVAWIVHELELLGSGGISALHSALRVKLTNQNTGAMTSADLRAGDFEIANTVATSTPVAKLTGVQVVVTNHSVASVDEAVGVRISMANSGTITKPYAIHADQGSVHVGDDLEVKVFSTPPILNPPAGFIKMYPKLDAGVPKLYAKDSTGAETQLGGGSGGGAPTDATYITQIPNTGLSNEQALSTLATGLLKNTTSTGVLSIATPGTDYLQPDGTTGDLKAADFPILTGDVTTAGGSLATTIANNAVTSAKVADNAITNAKLADNAVNTAEIANNAISTAKIVDDAVTLAKLAHGTANTYLGYNSSGIPSELSAPSSVPQGYIAGYEAQYDGTNLTLQPGICCSDDTTNTIKKTSVITINPATTGANGSETGALSANTWYYVFIILNTSSQVVAGFMSTSVNPTLPSGYTQKRRVAMVRTNASAVMYRFRVMAGGDNRRRVFWHEDTRSGDFLLMNTVNLTTTFTDLDCTVVVPPTSREVILATSILAAGGSTGAYWREKGTVQYMRIIHGGTAYSSGLYDLPLNNGQIGEVASITGGVLDENLTIEAVGYYDNLMPTIV